MQTNTSKDLKELLILIKDVSNHKSNMPVLMPKTFQR